MIAYFQVLIAVVVILHLVSQDVPLPRDVVEEMVMQTIEECDLPPLTGSVVVESLPLRQFPSPSKGHKLSMTIFVLMSVLLLAGLEK